MGVSKPARGVLGLRDYEKRLGSQASGSPGVLWVETFGSRFRLSGGISQNLLTVQVGGNKLRWAMLGPSRLARIAEALGPVTEDA